MRAVGSFTFPDMNWGCGNYERKETPFPGNIM